ncbi:DNA-binding transcription factor, Atf-CREB family Atf1 [Schizosaccharomyces osmophilus]|uniref:DNA-binding transcription factor, Atf-CREB family Atf1 n=1 Tax=Schizosaccharomyces osmophilus TaxID=2545709 RepID=A0AAE9W8C8_9SCHI|nr:DNA-binding transcription factor, Atf-CREB family Atf1 [Schizosaccharomyces osmophilus]WBW71154.1 DNA-binding transcription factor, Atf-CREB family Atf1 [Schizosaccharomyces osmophilus]
MSPSPNNAPNNYNSSEVPPNLNSNSAVNKNNPSVPNNIGIPSAQPPQQPQSNDGGDPLEQPAGVTPSFVGSLKLDFEPNPFEHSFGSTPSVNQHPGTSTNRPVPSAIPPSLSRTLLPPVSSIASPDILGAPGIASPLAYPAWSGFSRPGAQNPLSPAIYDATLRPDYLNTPSDPASMAMGSRFSFGTGFTPGGNESFRSFLTPTGASFPAPSPGTANLLGFQPFDSQYPDQYRFTPRDGKPPVSTGTNGEQSDYFGANAAVHGLCLLSQVPEQQKMQQSIPHETDPSTSAAVANLLKQSQSQQSQHYPESIRPSFTHNGNNPMEHQNMGQQPYYMNANQMRGDMQPSVYGETVNPADPSLNLRPSNNYGMHMNNMSHMGRGGGREVSSNGMPVQVKSEVSEHQESQPRAIPRAMSGNSNVSPSGSPSETDMKDIDGFNGDSSNSKSGSTPRRNSKNETDDEKRKSFLERNRQAALKCRQRKKQWLSNLQAKVEFYGNENEILSAQVSALREEIVSLKTLLIAHKECPVAKGNSAAVATTIIGNGDMSQRINLGY